VHGEDEDGSDSPPDDDWSVDDGPLRGWVPPDDRLWLHPSERTTVSGAGATAVPTLARPPIRSVWVVGGLTFCVVLTLAVSGIVLAAANGAGPPTASTVTLTGVPTTEASLGDLADAQELDAVASTVRASTVALIVSTHTGTTVGTGVVVEAGGIIVVMQPTIADARAITVVEPGGAEETAAIVGEDPDTGIVVLRIPDDLPVADFTGGDPSTGSFAVAMSEEAGPSAHRPGTHLYAGTVLFSGVGTGIGIGKISGLCETGVAAPLSAADLGSPLVDPTGAVIGIFDGVLGTGRSRISMFLPAQLVVDVAGQIVSRGSVEHGSLGAHVVDLPASWSRTSGPDGGGAMIESVSVGDSAAQGGLERGDLIVAIDGDEVRSVAELDTRLYAQPPGAELLVTFVRDGMTFETTVVLGNSQD
jgi:putative serine protease PepD